MNEAIEKTKNGWETHLGQVTRKREAEHKQDVDKLKAEIEDLKKPESPAEKAKMQDAATVTPLPSERYRLGQMLDAGTETDADTNDDWYHQAQQANAVIEQLKAEIEELKARFRTDVCRKMGVADAPAETDEVQEETADEKLKRKVAEACAGPGAQSV